MSDDRSVDEARWSAWMIDAQRGDRDTYARLLSELIEVVRAFLTKRFGSVDFVDDCVQESLIAVHEARHTYDPQRPFRAWLFAIVRYKAIDMLRHRESYSRALARAQVEAHEATVDSPHDAGDVIAALDPMLREALVLTKLQGFSMREAATRAGVSEGAMKVRVHRAIRAARQLIAAKEH
jgi:RNA polymerase sigma-70 factor (ECF subfamily)